MTVECVHMNTSISCFYYCVTRGFFLLHCQCDTDGIDKLKTAGI